MFLLQTTNVTNYSHLLSSSGQTLRSLVAMNPEYSPTSLLSTVRQNNVSYVHNNFVTVFFHACLGLFVLHSLSRRFRVELCVMTWLGMRSEAKKDGNLKWITAQLLAVDACLHLYTLPFSHLTVAAQTRISVAHVKARQCFC
jgi:hypothetical protein